MWAHINCKVFSPDQELIAKCPVLTVNKVLWPTANGQSIPPEHEHRHPKGVTLTLRTGDSQNGQPSRQQAAKFAWNVGHIRYSQMQPTQSSISSSSKKQRCHQTKLTAHGREWKGLELGESFGWHNVFALIEFVCWQPSRVAARQFSTCGSCGLALKKRLERVR